MKVCVLSVVHLLQGAGPQAPVSSADDTMEIFNKMGRDIETHIRCLPPAAANTPWVSN